MIFVAAIFDFFDGFAARMLNAKSPIGGELDSLSDVVSFGVAPSFIIAMLLSKTGISWMVADVNVFPMLAFILAAFAAVRLAKFNIDTRQSTSFIGLPVPAVGLFIASLPLMLSRISTESALYNFIVNPYFLLAIVAIFSWLMISEVPFFSFKIKSLRFKENILRYFVVIFAIVAFIILKLVALPFVFLFYILLSVICYRG
jgi:CDP-diacylglycerol--serine O-phosphatidyltransferase